MMGMSFVYVDNILSLSHRVKHCIAEITAHYKVKEGSIREPDIYLGVNIVKLQLLDGCKVWSTLPRSYVKNAVQVVEQLLVEDNEGYQLKSSAKNPFPTGYKLELDVTDKLGDRLASRYLQLIGVLRWVVEIGCLDIFLEMALLSQYQASPRIGHLKALYHIFAYLRKHPDMGQLAYDLIAPVIDESVFNSRANWDDFYGKVEEEMPPNMPKPRGNPNAPITWFSKRQNMVESATFGSKFVALRICKELIVALWYKLQMFGIPIDGPANVFCDNQGVVKNSSIPESPLLKKHNAINYHAVREAAAAGILHMGKEDGQTNLADLLAKVVTGERRWELCWNLMW